MPELILLSEQEAFIIKALGGTVKERDPTLLCGEDCLLANKCLNGDCPTFTIETFPESFEKERKRLVEFGKKMIRNNGRARRRIEALEDAVKDLLFDIRKRHPNEPLKCPHLQKLDKLIGEKVEEDNDIY